MSLLGSVIPPFLAHSFCNLMGLPPLAGALRQWPDKKLCESRRIRAYVTQFQADVALFSCLGLRSTTTTM